MVEKEPGIKAKIFAERLNAGPLSDIEASELESWLAEDDSRAAEYRIALNAIGHNDEDTDNSTDCETDRFYSQRPPARASLARNWKIPLGAFAFGLVLAVASFWVFSPAEEISAPSIPYYQTAIGEREEITLTDGSRVTLNTNSRVLVDFNKNRRHIILDRGEAFFDVESDASRPFTIDAGARVLTVLGTKFNVRLYPREITVSVVEGTVAMHSRDKAISSAEEFTATLNNVESEGIADGGAYRLDAGATVTLSLDSAQYVAATTSNVDQFDSWRYGILVFDNEPLSKVVRDINRYDPRDIIISGSNINQLKFSGVFHLDRTESMLAALEAILPVQINEVENQLIITANAAIPDTDPTNP